MATIAPQASGTAAPARRQLGTDPSRIQRQGGDPNDDLRRKLQERQAGGGAVTADPTAGGAVQPGGALNAGTQGGRPSALVPRRDFAQPGAPAINARGTIAAIATRANPPGHAPNRFQPVNPPPSHAAVDYGDREAVQGVLATGTPQPQAMQRVLGAMRRDGALPKYAPERAAQRTLGATTETGDLRGGLQPQPFRQMRALLERSGFQSEGLAPEGARPTSTAAELETRAVQQQGPEPNQTFLRRVAMPTASIAQPQPQPAAALPVPTRVDTSKAVGGVVPGAPAGQVQGSPLGVLGAGAGRPFGATVSAPGNNTAPAAEVAQKGGTFQGPTGSIASWLQERGQDLSGLGSFQQALLRQPMFTTGSGEIDPVANMAQLMAARRGVGGFNLSQLDQSQNDELQGLLRSAGFDPATLAGANRLNTTSGGPQAFANAPVDGKAAAPGALPIITSDPKGSAPKDFPPVGRDVSDLARVTSSVPRDDIPIDRLPRGGNNLPVVSSDPKGSAPRAMPVGGLPAGGGAPAPSLPGGMSEFGPGNDLISTQINPGQDDATAALVNRLRDEVATGPDRGELAGRTLQQLERESAPGFDAALRKIGQRAATFGRIGSGMVNTQLMDALTMREHEMSNARERASLDAADRTLGDRLNRLGAVAGLEGQRFGQGLTSRDELRGERGYQYGLSRDAQEDRIRKILLGSDLEERRFGNMRSLMEGGMDPLQALLAMAQYQGGGAAESSDAAMQLLRLLAMRRGGDSGGGVDLSAGQPATSRGVA